MARRWTFDNDMTAGEIAEQYLMRTDAVVRNRALKQARNVILQPGGGAMRRWGSRRLANLVRATRVESLGYGEAARLLCFQDARFQVRDLDGFLIEEVTGCPWTEADLSTMQIASEAGRIVVVSAAFYPYVLTESPLVADDWFGAVLTFAAGDGGKVLQPYYRFSASGIAITPSNYTGAITVHFSSPILDASWVGRRIRYDGVEILLGALIDSDDINATVTGTIYPTYVVTVASTTGFLVGQTVSGKDSEVEGFVAEVVDATTLRVQLHASYTPFGATEVLIGPTGFSTISALGQDINPAPTVVWDEQALGNPTAVALHRNRLLLAGLDAAPNLLMASVTGDITNFDTGTGLDTDAIVETIGKDETLRILSFGSAEQLLIFTENGIYYVPEQVAAPLSPTNLEILRIGPEVAGISTPLLVSEGMLFTEDGSGRLMIAEPTGNVRRSWDVADLAEMAFHLSGNPVEIEMLPATSATDRLVFALRDDGQISVMTYRRGAEYTGWTPWSRSRGAWRSLVVAHGRLHSAAETDGEWHLERFDANAFGDSVVVLNWDQEYGSFGNETVSAWYGVNKLGDYATSPDGVLIGIGDEYPVVDVGYDFTLTVEIVPQIDSNYGTSRLGRVCRAWFDMISSMPFKANGFTPSGFSAPDVGGLVPPVSGRLSCTFLGHKFDPTLTLVQDQGGPWNCRSLTGEVVY